jgi:hypothetical protein
MLLGIAAYTFSSALTTGIGLGSGSELGFWVNGSEMAYVTGGGSFFVQSLVLTERL